MKLVSNWRRVLRHAWSAYGLYVLFGLSGLEVFLSVFAGEPPMDRMTFAAIYTVVSVLTLIARITEQKSLHNGE